MMRRVLNLIRLCQIEVQALASRMNGDRNLAGQLGLQAQEIAVHTAHRPLRRRAYIDAADCHMLKGDMARATDAARLAITLGPPTVDNPGILGHYCRWLGRIESRTPRETAKTCGAVRKALGEPLDFLDKVEVLGTLASLGQISEKERDELAGRVAILPHPTIDQLTALGLAVQKDSIDLDSRGRWGVGLAPPPAQEEAVV